MAILIWPKDSAGIYVASKTPHAGIWRRMREDGVPIISTWIDEDGPGQTRDREEFWDRCIREVTSCGVVVAMHVHGETPKGGLVEIGAALAAKVPVIAVSFDPDAHTWAHHSSVVRVNLVEKAFVLANDILSSSVRRQTCKVCRGSGFDPDRFRTGDRGKSCPSCSGGA